MGYITVSNQNCSNLVPVIQRNMGKRWCSGSLISLVETSESFWVNYGCYGFLWHKIKRHSNRRDKWLVKTVTNSHLFTSALIPGSSSSYESLSVKDIFSYSRVLTLEKCRFWLWNGETSLCALDNNLNVRHLSDKLKFSESFESVMWVSQHLNKTSRTKSF